MTAQHGNKTKSVPGVKTALLLPLQMWGSLGKRDKQGQIVAQQMDRNRTSPNDNKVIHSFDVAKQLLD